MFCDKEGEGKVNQQEQELMERYIYQVVRRLPKNQRKEVARELQELIGDMAEQEGSTEEALLQLGDPALFAAKYREDAACLIGPEYYDTWRWFVKVVLLCDLIPVALLSLAGGFREGFAQAGGSMLHGVIAAFTQGLVHAITNSVITCMGAFGFVTFIFAVLERQNIGLDHDRRDDKKQREQWTPRRLSPIPNRKAVISRGDCVVSIVFIVLFAILMGFAPQLFAVICKSGDGMVMIPVLNLEEWSRIFPVLVISLLVGLADEILKLMAGVYNRLVMASCLVCNVIQIFCSVLLLKVLPFWNPHFKEQLQQTEGSKSGILMNMGGAFFSDLVLVICIGIVLIEVGVTVYKTLRYAS